MDDDDRRLSDKLSGRIRRPSDAGGKRTLEGFILRSPIPSGEISSMELPETPADLAYVTAHDIPGRGKLTVGGKGIPLLAKKNILWKGQPILIAAGPDAGAAIDWLSRVEIVFKDKNAAADTGDRTVGVDSEWIKGDTKTSFASAFQVVEESFEIPYGPHGASGGTTTCIRDGSSYTIHAATPWPGAVRRHAARTLGVEKSHISVRPYSVGPGSCGLSGMWATMADACCASLLSWKSKRSVGIVIPPGDEATIGPPPGGRFHIRGAVDAEGRILALEAEFTLFAGALLPLETEILNRVALGIAGIAPVRNYSITGRVSYGSSPPSDLGPGAGFELGFLAGELFASRVADHCLLSPGDWRRSTLPANGRYFGPGITIPKDFSLPRVLDIALTASDFDRKHAAYEQTRLGRSGLSEKPSVFGGVGISCAWFGNGFLGSPRELGSASLSATLGLGSDLEIDMPPYVTGGALTRAWINIAKEILGVEDSTVKFTVNLPKANIDPGPSIMGMNVSVYTKLLEQACNDLAKRRFREALPLTASRNRRRTAKRPRNSGFFEGHLFETTSWGVCIVETEFSTETLAVRPVHMWLFIDGGQLLMPEHARSAVEAETEKALAWCMGETFVRKPPLIDVAFYDSRSKRPPRDVSTLPWLLVPAAFIRSVRLASDTEADRMPITPEFIMKKRGGR